NSLKNVQEVCRIYTATANPVQVLVAETNQGKGVIGVVDGFAVVGVENAESKKHRHEFLRKIGYKR
ncbi:MAG: adenosine-specific kinase, partial [Zestosphaera sp.]